MKFFRNITVLLLAATLSACNDEAKEYNPAVTLSFNPAIMANTRAEAGVYPQDIPFGVCGLRNDVQAGNVMFMNDVQVCNTAGDWLPQTEYLWTSREAHTYVAYSPYGCGAAFTADGGIELSGYNVTAEDACDFMFTSPVECLKDKCHGQVSLAFVRALACVEFKLRSTASNDVQLRLRSLKIGDIVCDGDFRSQPQPHWVLGNETCDVEFFSGDIPVTRRGIYLDAQMVMPQKPGRPVTVVLDVYNADGELQEEGVTLHSESINAVWRVGKMYSYTIDVSPDDVTFTTEYLD